MAKASFTDVKKHNEEQMLELFLSEVGCAALEATRTKQTSNRVFTIR